MPNRPAFGRRVAPQMPPAAPVRTVPVVEVATLQPVPPPVPDAEPLTVEQELQAWKEARGSQFRMPWSQLSLMASLCFGIASFVLPDSVNDSVQWLLWGLSAMAAIVWWSNRTKRKVAVKASSVP
jgi:hypothetical protein